jgi:hypothetical protein
MTYPRTRAMKKLQICRGGSFDPPVHAVAELLGHADPTLVIKRYGHALPSERSTAGERLEAFLARPGAEIAPRFAPRARPPGQKPC